MLTDPTDGPDSEGQGDDAAHALTACLMEIERHIDAGGWDQPPLLFALVPTVELEAAEPHLARTDLAPPDRLSAIQQDEFDAGDDVIGALARVMWPDAVTGCAMSLVRSFLPAGAEADLPDDPAEAEAYVQQHPERQDVRAVIGVLRSGGNQGVARLQTHPEDLLSGPELLPGVIAALAGTFTAVGDA